MDYDDGEIVVNMSAMPKAPILGGSPLRSAAVLSDLPPAQHTTAANAVAEFDPLIPQDWMINFDSPRGQTRMPAQLTSMATPVAKQSAQSKPMVLGTPLQSLIDAPDANPLSPQSMAKYSERDVAQICESIQKQVSITWKVLS